MGDATVTRDVNGPLMVHFSQGSSLHTPGAGFGSRHG